MLFTRGDERVEHGEVMSGLLVADEEEERVKFALIDAEKAQWPVEVQCAVLGVSRSGYYAWKDRPEAPRAAEDAELVVEIKAAHKAGRGNYGSPRVHRELRAKGRRVGKKRVPRLMRREGILGRRKKASVRRTALPSSITRGRA